MKHFLAILLAALLSLSGVLPSYAGNKDLRMKIENAREAQVMLRVVISSKDSAVGKVVSVEKEIFILQNPVTMNKQHIRWGNVQQVREVPEYSSEWTPGPQGWIKHRQKITVHLIDGNELKGIITRVEPTGLAMEERSGEPEVFISNKDIMSVDHEPTGQKLIRKVMIGVGVSLAAALMTLAYLMRGD